MKNSPRSPGGAAEECNLVRTTNSSQTAQQSTSDNQQQEKPQQAESISDNQQQDKPLQVKPRSDNQQQEKPEQAKQRPTSGQQTPTREQNLKQIEQECKRRRMKSFTSLQRQKVLQNSTQEEINRDHKNRGAPLAQNWVRSTQNAKHKQAMANKKPTGFYKHYVALPRAKQEE